MAAPKAQLVVTSKGHLARHFQETTPSGGVA